jgi:8-oxo-dGTP pyrophosphatase MutT (NUDIX family)
MKNDKVEVIARGVCLKSGMILLCRTNGARNTYLPGGHVEFMETARESLEREIVEELGVESVAGEFLGMVEHSFIQNGRRHCEWNVFFDLNIPSLDPADDVAAAENHISFQWCDISGLKGAELEPAVLCDLIPQWLIGNGRRWESGGDFKTD